MSLQPFGDLSSRALLVVENEESLREIYQSALSSDGWEISFALTAADVKSGLSDVAGTIADWQTMEVLGLQNSKELQSKPLVVVSTDAECPVHGFIQKPFEMQRFARTVFTRCAGASLYKGDQVVSAITPHFGNGTVVGKSGADTYLVEFPEMADTIGTSPISCHRTALRFAKAPASLSHIIKGFGSA